MTPQRSAAVHRSHSVSDLGGIRKTFKEAFTRDVINHVLGPAKGGTAGGLGAWEYSEPEYEGDPVHGSQDWDAYIDEHDDVYYIVRAEKTLAQKTAPLLPQLITQPVAIAHLGIGAAPVFRSKDIPLCSYFNYVVSGQSFDINSRYVAESLPELEQAYPDAIHGGMVVDLFSIEPGTSNPHARFDFPGNGAGGRTKTRLATMFGGTLVNFAGSVDEGAPEEKTIERLKMIRRSLGKGGFFVVTQDSNQDADKIMAAYEHQTEFACNLAHRINRDTPYNVHPEKTQFRVQWHPKSSVLAHYLRFDGKGLPNPINKEIHINNSYKIPNDQFLEWGRKAGFVFRHSEQENGVYLHVLEATK